MPCSFVDSPAGRVAWYPPPPRLAPTPLVAIAGGPGADHRYLCVGGGFDRVGALRRLVYYDQRGSGRSSPAAADETIDRFVADLEAVRAALGAGVVDVIGHSFGAYLAMAYAARHPDQLRSLILVSAMAPAPGETLQLLDAVFPDRIEEWRRTRAALPARFPASVIALFHTFEFVDGSAHARYAREVAAHVYNIELNNILRADMEQLDFSAALRAWRKPALVVHGRFDAVLAPSIGWKLHKMIPTARMAFLERSGHMPFIEEPDAFAAAVLGFLNDVDAGKVA
jgi:proline iminopeptidase